MKLVVAFFMFLSTACAQASTWIEGGSEIELTSEMVKDAKTSKPCPLETKSGDTVVDGRLAVYLIDGDNIRAFKDMYAERYVLDYCSK